jgi:hypothetical protein
MKIKKFEKKLALNKKTIANLNGNEMNTIKGGLLWQSKVDPEACANETGDIVCESCVSCYETCPVACSAETFADCPASIVVCL